MTTDLVDEQAHEQVPRCSRRDVDACAFASWYSRFSTPRKLTISSRIIRLSPAFVQYLRGDGILLPKSCLAEEEEQADHRRQLVEDVDVDEDDDDEEEWDNQEEEATFPPEFPELQQAIQDALEEFEFVFPKLNWSAPQDANWMLPGGRLSCSSVHDVLLLLKSSDSIAHDLDPAQVYADCTDVDVSAFSEDVSYSLVLRKWFDLQPSSEFRCFVKNRRLIAICQRDFTNYYPFLREQLPEIRKKIWTFFKQHLRPDSSTTSEESLFPLESYVFDVYISRSGTVWLIDFNVFAPPTHPMLFEWHELMGIASPIADNETQEEAAIQIRIVESQQHMRPSIAMYNRLPSDLVDFSNLESIQGVVSE